MSHPHQSGPIGDMVSLRESRGASSVNDGLSLSLNHIIDVKVWHTWQSSGGFSHLRITVLAYRSIAMQLCGIAPTLIINRLTVTQMPIITSTPA